MRSAILIRRELADGYAFQIKSNRVSVVEVAEWVDLERKYCPFFDFQVDLHGAEGALWLSLAGREGTKQFIEEEFRSWRDIQ